MVTTAVLALGAVAVGVAAPASAHANAITASVSCTDDFEWQIKRTLVNDFVGDCGAPKPAAVGSTGLYLYPKLDASKPAAWENSGPQKLVSTWDGWSYKGNGQYPAALPAYVCGPDWGVQQDQINGARSLFPATISYPKYGGFGSGVLHAARHDNLSALMPVPACAPIPTVTVTTGACTVSGELSSREVTIALNNTGNAPVTFTSTMGLSATLQPGESKRVSAKPVGTSGAKFTVVATGTGSGVGFTKTFPITIPAFAGCRVVVVPPTPQSTIVAVCSITGASTDVFVNNNFTPAPLTMGASFVAQIYVNGVLGSTLTVASGTVASRHLDFASASGVYTVVVKVDGAVIAEKVVDSACSLVTGADPTAQTCVDSTLVDGRIRVLLNPHLVYKIDGTVVTAADTTVIPGAHTVTAELADPSGIYVLRGESRWILTSDSSSGACDLPPKALVVPTVTTTASTCEVGGSYTLSPTEGVVWTVDGVVKPAGTYPAAASTRHIVATTASSDFGFAVDTQTNWSPTFGSPGDCFNPPTLALLTPTASSAPITCSASGSYTLGNLDGVIWKVDGAVKPAGTYSVQAAATVNAVATTDPSQNGFEQGAQTRWTFVFTGPPDCGELPTHPLVIPAVSMVNRTCAVNGSYTLGAVDGVIYTVNGTVQAAGTYPVSTAKTLSVLAATRSSDFGFAEGTQTTWTLGFTDPGNCAELTTLAFTGSNGTLAAGLLLGLVFLVLGAGIVTVSRVRHRTRQ